MQYFPELKNSTSEALESDEGTAVPGSGQEVLQDRSAPGWASLLSFCFTAGGAVCLTAFCILTAFLHALVVEQKQLILAPLLAVLALAPALGMVIFDAAHGHALRGHRRLRDRHTVTMKALAAVTGTAVLALIHPLLSLPVLAGSALCWLAAGPARPLFRREPMWDFLPAEAVSVLSGRDRIGHVLARQPEQDSTLLRTWVTAMSWLSLTAGFALAARLAALEVLAPSAVPALALITYLCVRSIGRHLQARRPASGPDGASSVTSLAALLPEEQLEKHPQGLLVEGLNAFSSSGKALLADVSFTVEPGTVTCIDGGSSAGKSLLLRCLADPYGQEALDIRGAVLLEGEDLWTRSAAPQRVPAVHIPPVPLILPASGSQNLGCFHGGEELERGRKILRQMAFSSETAEAICAAPDARLLSGSEQKMLAFARAFLLRPRLLLLDRPEDGAGAKQIAALAARLQQDRRLGLAVLMVTSSRKLQELSDRVLVMQGGRIIDQGPAEEIRARTTAGWSRFVTERELASEEALDSWLASQFRRDGDAANRRKVCMLANELLAFSCQGVSGLDLQQELRFEFKHFDGHCLLRMLDQAAPLSSGVLEQARQEAAEGSGARLSPLAAVFKGAMEVQTSTQDGQRVIEARIETYDPRLGIPKEAAGHGRRE